MSSRADLKARAKASLKVNLLIIFVSIMISSIVVSIPVVGMFLYPVIYVGLIALVINASNGFKADIGTLFVHFPIFLKAFGLIYLMGIFVMLWSFLLVIPGIIKTYSYAMAPYIMAENPNKGVFESINDSKRMMNGHKMELFMLSLSFIPWLLLVGVTFGIAIIYVAPYMQLTFANFYKEVKAMDGGIPQQQYTQQ